MFKEIVEFSKELEKENIFELAKDKETLEKGNLVILQIKENAGRFFIDNNKIFGIIIENFEIKRIIDINRNEVKLNTFDNYFLDICKKIKYLTKKFPSDIKGNKSIGANKGLNSYNWFIFSAKDNKDLEKKLTKEKLSKTYNKRNVEIFLQKSGVYFKKQFHPQIKNFILQLPDLLIDKNIKSSVLNIFDKDIYCVLCFSKDILVNNNYTFYEEIYLRHLKKNIFKQDKSFDSLCDICKKNKGVFMPESFNNLAGSDGIRLGKKPFILHQNRPTKINISICKECAFEIFKFQRFFLEDFKVRLFPLFIEPELKNEEIKLLSRFKNNKEGIGFAGFKKVLYSVTKNYKDDMSFYLVLYNNNNNILAFDYITGYKYYLDFPMINYSFYKNKENEKNEEDEEYVNIRNIFHIERELDYFLGEILIGNYFEDKIELKSKKDEGKNYLVNLIYKNRTGIFNLVYRNNKNEFSLRNLEEIFLVQIKHKILDETGKEIKKYINHFINLYIALKDNFYSNQGGIDMEELRTLNEKLVDVIKNAETQEKLKNELDNFFRTLSDTQKKNVFSLLLGQVVYYILSQSKAGDKTHSLVEGFVNVGNLGILAQRIQEYFNKYKHEIEFNYWKFNQIMSEVLIYCQDNNSLPFRDIETIFYIGYFESNVFYQKSN